MIFLGYIKENNECKKKKSPKLKRTTIANQEVDEYDDDDFVFNEEDIDSYREDIVNKAPN